MAEPGGKVEEVLLVLVVSLMFGRLKTSDTHQRHPDDFVTILGQEAFGILLDKDVFLDLKGSENQL